MRRFKQFVFNSLSSHLATGTTSRTANPTAAAAVTPRQTTAAAATATATTPTPPPKTAETFPPLRRKTTRTRPRRRPQTITIKGDQASAGLKCSSSNISHISLFFLRSLFKHRRRGGRRRCRPRWRRWRRRRRRSQAKGIYKRRFHIFLSLNSSFLTYDKRSGGGRDRGRIGMAQQSQ